MTMHARSPGTLYLHHKIMPTFLRAPKKILYQNWKEIESISLIDGCICLIKISPDISGRISYRRLSNEIFKLFDSVMYIFEILAENSMHWAGHTHGLSCIALCFGLSEALSTMLDLFTTLRTSRFVHISLPICIHIHSADGHTYPMTGHVLYRDGS